MSGAGDNNAGQYSKTDEVLVKDSYTPQKTTTSNGLIVIELPPTPDDFCKICDPIMATDLRLAIFSTLFCWLPLGIFPVIFGLISICFAVKASNTEDPKKRELYSARANTISWLGMMLFVTVLTVGVIVVATCGII